MSVNCYLKVDTVPGESQAENHPGEIEISSYSWAGSAPGVPEAGGGLAAGKVTMADLAMTKRVDKATPLLFKHCCKGNPIPNVVLSVDRAGENPTSYMKITLNDAVVTSYQLGGSGGDLPMESFSLNYTKVNIEYTPLDEKGSPQGSLAAAYDLKKAEGE